MDTIEFTSLVPVGTESSSRPAASAGRSEPARSLGEDATAVAPLDPDDVEDAVERINENAQMVSRDLEFSVSDESGRIIVTVRDSNTEEVIRQIPPEKLMAVAESLDEVRGLLFEAEA